MANTSHAWSTCSTSIPKLPIPIAVVELRRKLGATHRRGASANLGQAGSARTLRLRVSSQWYGQSLRSPRRASSLAQGQSHRAASGRRLRPMHAHLVDIHYPDAEIIRVVQDNLSTHSTGALDQRSRPPKPGGSCDGSSSTTPRSTQAGSTWSRSRSASCAVSAWIAGSTTPNDYAAKSQPGSDGEMPPAPASNGSLSPEQVPKPNRSRAYPSISENVDSSAVQSH